MEGYKVKYEGEKEVQLRKVGEGKFEVDGNQISLDISDLGNGKFHILKNHKSYNAEVIEINRDSKKVSIKVNGNVYDLDLEDKYDLLLQKLGMDSIGSAAVSDLPAPMPGLVLNVEVKAGESVIKDQALVVLEAMKMENVLKSPIDGIIKEVLVQNNDTVEKNQTLIKFES